MTRQRFNSVLQQIQRLVQARPAAARPHAELLDRFVRHNDQAAFETIVWRHGPMVLGICRRLLDDLHDAEDAFQATFLLLVRKAKLIRKSDSLASWLYKVAYHVTVRARARVQRQTPVAATLESFAAAPPGDEPAEREIRSTLDDAIQHLPERYRQPIVLCYLQGKRIREAAAELNCPIATVSTRLVRARALLRRELTRRGVTLTAGAIAAVFVRETSSAVIPPLLVTSTLAAASSLLVARGAADALPGSVRDLLDSVGRTLLLGKLKSAALAASAVIMLIAAGLAAQRYAVPSAAEPPAAQIVRAQSTPASNEAPPRARQQHADSVVVTGRVLGPDGKPITGAHLYSPHVLKPHPGDRPEDIEIASRGETAADGRFRFELSTNDLPAGFDHRVIAVAAQYGRDWCVLPQKPPYDLELCLPSDQPIRGRILNTEGRPVAGVRVSGAVLFAAPEENLDPFLAVWKIQWPLAVERLPKRISLWPSAMSPATETDASGRFEIRGIGIERFAKLTIEGAGIAKTALHVVTRRGFDPAPYNSAAHAPLPDGGEYTIPITNLYGPTFEYVAPRTRIIEGTVRDAGTRQTLAGVSVAGATGGGEILVSTASDVNGRYRLVGLAKAPWYWLNASASEKAGWLPWQKEIPDTEGQDPIRHDISISRGAIATGRVVDRATGQGVASAIRVVPLAGNRSFGSKRYEGYRPSMLWSGTDEHGNFRVACLPGSAAVVVQTDGAGGVLNHLAVNPYKLADPDLAERKRLGVSAGGRSFATAAGWPEELDWLNGCKYVDLPETGAAPPCIVEVDPGRKVQVEVQDADGKPLPGACVSGMTPYRTNLVAMWAIAFSLTEPSCTIDALDGKASRTVLFYHKSRRLAAALEVRSDEQHALRVRLAPTGAACGRLLDAEGKPLVGVTVEQSMDEVMRGLFRVLGEPIRQVVTDSAGRFRLDGLVPNADFGVLLHRGRTRLQVQKGIGKRQVAPGKMLDLGDIRTK